MTEQTYILLRFFDKEEYVEFFRTGNIRMMSARHYKEIEQKSVKLYNNRYDALENSAYIYNPDADGNIIFKEPIPMGDKTYTKMWVRPNCVKSPVVISNEQLDNITKILCLYSINIGKIVDGNMSSVLSTMEESFGDYYCLVTNGSKFLSRITNAISHYNNKKIVRNGQYGLVEYVNERTFCGTYGPFRKPMGLSWQNEFRVKLETLNKDPFIINIGDIKDITVWGKVSDLFNAKIDKEGKVQVENSKN